MDDFIGDVSRSVGRHVHGKPPKFGSGAVRLNDPHENTWIFVKKSDAKWCRFGPYIIPFFVFFLDSLFLNPSLSL